MCLRVFLVFLFYFVDQHASLLLRIIIERNQNPLKPTITFIYDVYVNIIQSHHKLRRLTNFDLLHIFFVVSSFSVQ